MNDRPLSPVLVAAFETVMAARTIHCIYQPIVALDTGSPVAYEALARGPAGTSWFMPDALVGYAMRVGRLPELDWICRAAACRGALAAKLPPDVPLFVNVEPASSRTRCPPDLLTFIRPAVETLQIVAEITERSVASDPAGLLGALDVLREYSNRIALDDVGADAATQAMMSLIQPDVIKIDRSVVQAPDAPSNASVIAAVCAESDRTGAVILAEGIETPEHLASAKAMRATFGQGWLFGRPGPLPRQHERSGVRLPHLAPVTTDAVTPFQVATRAQVASPATKPTLLALSRSLEDLGLHADEPTVLLTTFQHARFFDEATHRRYRTLAENGILTATFAEGMPPRPAPQIQGVSLEPSDPLVGEWNVIVVGSRFAGGLFAKERVTVDGREREFDLVESYDRDLVLAAARPLLARLSPADPVSYALR
jgi:EAL domain-containing protein (putative c-di-GMP-specific phosphodiesterase class I)